MCTGLGDRLLQPGIAGLVPQPQRSIQDRSGGPGAGLDRSLRLLGQGQQPFLLRSDNALVFTSRSYAALVKGYGLQQEFITPYSPEQNGMVERVNRTLKDQCVHRHRFETLQHASRVIGDWIRFDSEERRHQARRMKTPAEAYALAT